MVHVIRNERLAEELSKLGWEFKGGFWIPNWATARNTTGAVEQMRQACLAAVECPHEQQATT